METDLTHLQASAINLKDKQNYHMFALSSNRTYTKMYNILIKGTFSLDIWGFFVLYNVSFSLSLKSISGTMEEGYIDGEESGAHKC